MSGDPWDTSTSWAHTYWPRDQHEYMFELVKRDHGGAAPEWAIAADLVYFADLGNHPKRPKPFPGRRWLEARWGVSERVARRMLASAGWQRKVASSKLAPPHRDLKGVPVTVPPASPSPSPSATDERAQSSETVPVVSPSPSPSPSTRARFGSTDPRIYKNPPNPPPAAGGYRRRSDRASPSQDAALRWVSDRALREVGALVPTQRPEALLAYELARGALVDVWVRCTRPQPVRALGGELVDRREWPDAPDGLRKSDIRAGLRDAARRWRAGERPPLCLEHPPADDRPVDDHDEHDPGAVRPGDDGEPDDRQLPLPEALTDPPLAERPEVFAELDAHDHDERSAPQPARVNSAGELEAMRRGRLSPESA